MTGGRSAKTTQVQTGRKALRITRRPLTGVDIAEAWNYIAGDSVDEADAWIDRLDGKLRLLVSQPRIGRVRDELASGLRSVPFGRYVIFYEPLADGIDVVRVLHCARDINRAFGRHSRPR